jgi:inner membrane protein
MNDTPQKPVRRFESASKALKLGIIGFLILIFLIPVAWISSLIRERHERRDTVINEIAGKSGSSQIIGGPFISVPYHWIVSQNKVDVIETAYIHVTADNMNVTAKTKSEIYHRGIFSVSGYLADVNITADFTMKPIVGLLPENAELDWANALISFNLKDQHGLKELNGKIDGQNLLFIAGDQILSVVKPATVTNSLKKGMRYGQEEKTEESIKFKYAAKIPIDVRAGNHQITVHLISSGTQQLNFLASGMQETIQIQGDWKSPSFTGDLLPQSRNVDKQGFTATWHTNFLTTGNKQYWSNSASDIQLANVGVDFLIMVDSYQQATRALKYAILFLLLTFMTFFFTETITKQRIHPIQYLMVGCSLIIFYLLLLSLSEHMRFGWAYLVAAIGIVMQISLYCYSILKTRKFAMQVGGLLSGLYVFLYILLRLEDSALLIGSISLFVLLGIAMYAIRNVNWYGTE